MPPWYDDGPMHHQPGWAIPFCEDFLALGARKSSQNKHDVA